MPALAARPVAENEVTRCCQGLGVEWEPTGRMTRPTRYPPGATFLRYAPGVEREPLAVRSDLRFEARLSRCRLRVVSLRRPDVVLRATRYAGIVVDERVLTRAFPWVATPSHALALVVNEGRIVWDELVALPGDVVLLRPDLMARGRFEDAGFVELEWPIVRGPSLSGPVRVGTSTRADALRVRFEDPPCEQRATFRDAFDAFRAAGVDHGLSSEALVGGPTELEVRIAAGIDAQLASLATAADARTLAEAVGLSERQLQRRIREYMRKHHQNARSWRDLRNRWRVQIAAVLLGNGHGTVAEVASEVGYASATALARALAIHGMPPPRALRARFSCVVAPT